MTLKNPLIIIIVRETSRNFVAPARSANEDRAKTGALGPVSRETSGRRKDDRILKRPP